MTAVNFPLMMSDHAESSLRELDAEIAKTTAHLTRLHQERMQLMAHVTLHQAFNPHQESTHDAV